MHGENVIYLACFVNGYRVKMRIKTNKKHKLIRYKPPFKDWPQMQLLRNLNSNNFINLTQPLMSIIKDTQNHLISNYHCNSQERWYKLRCLIIPHKDTSSNRYNRCKDWSILTRWYISLNYFNNHCRKTQFHPSLLLYLDQTQIILKLHNLLTQLLQHISPSWLQQLITIHGNREPTMWLASLQTSSISTIQEQLQ